MTDLEYFDFKVRASEVIVPMSQETGIPDELDIDRKDAGDQESLSLTPTIIAVSEGIHNGTEVTAAELKKMVDRAHGEMSDGIYPVPIVLDHSDRFLDKVGSTLELEFHESYPADSENLAAVIARIEFWEDTPIQKEAAARIRRDPANTFFSIRFAGRLNFPKMRDDPPVWSDMHLIHIAVVNEPADSNARIIRFSKAKSDFDLYSDRPDTIPMEQTEDFEARISALEAALSKQKESEAKAEFEQAKADQTAQLHRRAELLVSLKQLDPEYNQDFVNSLSNEQLDNYNASIERLFPKDSNEKGSFANAQTDTVETLARKLME